MRAYRKRSWAALAVNMTPLIDVVFLIIIFFIIMINFSERHISNVNLPKADETRDSQVDKKSKLPIIIKSPEMIFLDRKKIEVTHLDAILKARDVSNNTTITIQADETVSYELIKETLHKLSLAGINRIEFSTLKFQPDPLQKD